MHGEHVAHPARRVPAPDNLQPCSRAGNAPHAREREQVSEKLSYTASTKHPRWVNLSNSHRIAKEGLEKRLKGFFFGTEPIPASAIVGPYGSGKTELMFHSFRYIWHELRRPAFYMNLETLLSLLPSELAPRLFYSEVGNIVRRQIKTLREILKGDHPNLRPCLPGLEDGETLQDYFKQCNIDFEMVNEAIKSDEAVLFVDEMEAHYKNLRERLKTSDLSSIRKFLEDIEQKRQKPRFYVVMGFALGSAYETLGGAEARRKNTILLPLPDPGEFVNLFKEEEEKGLFRKYGNLLWWASRGRPGWALMMLDSWGKQIDEAKRIDEEIIRRFFHERIEGLPYIDTSKINEFVTEDNSQAFKQLILGVKPIAKELLSSPVEAVIDSLGFRYVFVSNSLVAMEELLEAFISDLKKIPSSYVPDLMILRDYVRRVLEATSDSGSIAFGGWKSELEAFAKAVVAPMLLILHDLVLEFEGDTKEGRETWNFLHNLVADLKAGDEMPGMKEILAKFGATRQLFKGYFDERQVNFIQPSFKLVEELFPRLVVKPLLILNENAKSDIKSQRNHLEGAVESSRIFLEQTVQIDDIRVRFIFTPSASCLPMLQEVKLSPMERDNYLPYEQIIVVLNLKKEDGLRLDYLKNSELRVIEELGKLCTTQLEERRISDFIASLWHNLSISGESLSSNLLEILEDLKEKVKKNTRRTIEYYTDLIRDRLETLAKIVARDYMDKAWKIFPYRSSDFPGHVISDVTRVARETRAAEQVAVAFDICLDRNRTLDALASLRQMDRLSDMPTRLHGYKEFLRRYTVTLRKPLRPSSSIDSIVEFIKRYESLGKLRDYAKDLPHDMGVMPAWMELTERAANSPFERMFGWSPESRIFLQGLYLRVFLENNKNDLLGKSSELSKSISDTGRRLKQLVKDIKDLNETLGKNILSSQVIEEILQELEQAGKLLEGARQISPAVLYVTYRFLNAAIEKVEEERQSWAGTTVGIEAWRSKLYDTIRLKEYLEKLNQRLQNLYQINIEFKENEIGKLEEIVNKEAKKLRAAADEVLSQLTTYELGESVPYIDLNPFNEAKEEVDRFIDDLEVKVQQVDGAFRIISLIKNKINNLYEVMTL